MAADADGNEVKAKHKVRKSGGKVKKKQANDKKARHNPKAFTFSGGINSVHRKVQRTLDIQTKREKANLTPNKTPEENAPPYIVAVQGPPGVGKSTLIRSLVKHYTKHNLLKVKGPVTLVSGKSRRLTFVECSNDIPVLLDVAKVADLVLLMIDGSFGFEMETFEFLNILQVHGFPRILGVLTHLDSIPEKKILRTTKKKLKNRFWSEIYAGAKLFYLSGLQYGRYNKTEGVSGAVFANIKILNLTRFISVQKYTPLSFRSQRPYLLSLRCEDHTPPDQENPEIKTVHVYGYLKGATMRSGTSVHIPGAGDFYVKSVEEYPDPCPTPLTRQPNANDGGRLLRTLKNHEKRIYAPDCDIGNVHYEADGMYIHLPDHKVGFTRPVEITNASAAEDDGEKSESDSESKSDGEAMTVNEEDVTEAVSLVRTLQEADGQLDRKLEQQIMKLLPTSTVNASVAHESKQLKRRRRVVLAGTFQAFGRETENYESDSDESDSDESRDDDLSDDTNQKVVDIEEEGRGGPDNDGDNDEDDAEDIENEFDHLLLGKRKGVSHAMVAEKFKNEIKLEDLVYGLHKLQTDKNEVMSWWDNIVSSKDVETVRKLFDDDDLSDDEHEASNHQIKGNLLGNCSGSRHVVDKDETSYLKDGMLYKQVGMSEESLQSIETFWSQETKKYLRSLHFITGGWDGQQPSINEATTDTQTVDTKSSADRIAEIEQEMKEEQEKNKALSIKKKELLLEAQNLIKEQQGGVIIGSYVRLVIDKLPSRWFKYVKDKTTPFIVGGLLAGEAAAGMLQARIKKHRWAPKILKTNDPVLISCGWRRFQSIPMYCMEDRSNVRVKMLKYTPEHLHCLATLYGPLCAPSSGVLAVRNWATNVKSFRISATGLILDTAPDFRIMKKLKLVGEPHKIHKNTAFIKKMFNSDLEVAKCIGAKIQTVSGLRGQIKKAQGKDGTFRATFEDKILMSDIVVCKAWIRVEPKRFMNPIMDVPEFRRLRTQAEIRNALQLPAPNCSASEYGIKQERQTRRFNPLKVPKKLAIALPFKSRPKEQLPKKKKTGLVAEATASTLSEYDRTVATLFNRLHLMAKAKQKDRTESMLQRKAKKEKAEAKVNAIRAARQKETRKRRNALKGAQEARDRKRLRIED